MSTTTAQSTSTDFKQEPKTVSTTSENLDEVLEQSKNNDNVEKIVVNQTAPAASSWWSPSSWTAWRWKPTSVSELEQAEREMLSVSGVQFEQSLLKINDVEHEEPVYINTLKAGQGPPLLLLHGFGAGIGFWVGNLKALSENNTVYAIDLLGFGRSSRHPFNSKSTDEAEDYFVSTIEKWRQASKVPEKFTVMGHSFGGYLASVYTLKHPENVSHLILADPWGVPERPQDATIKAPLHWRVIASVLSNFNPLATVRAAGPYGPGLVSRFRSDLSAKFVHLYDDPQLVTRYIYHLNAQEPMGETAFATLTSGFAWAQNPLINRLGVLPSNIKVTMLYGDHTWMDSRAGLQVAKELGDRADFHIIPNSGHHLYIDNHKDFNRIVTQALREARK